MLRLTALQMTRQARFASVYLAAANTLVRTSRVARQTGSVIMGRSMSSSIGRIPSCDQIRSYSRRASSSVGCGDQWMPKFAEAIETDGYGARVSTHGRVQVDVRAHNG